MKFAYGLPAILLGAVNVMVSHQVAVALKPPEVNAIAEKITVLISGPEAGSGVIVKKEGNIYTVLTNRHVIDTAGTYTIQTQDGSRYLVKSNQVTSLYGVDLAVFQFQSNQNYQPANIINSDKVTEGTKVYAAGFARIRGCQDQKKSCYKFFDGSINEIRSPAKNGYELVHNSQVRPGMSGGPLLDEDGKLIGINGQAISDVGLPVADFLAIPINTYKKIAPVITIPKSALIRFTLARTLTGSGAVNKVLFTPDGRILASGSENNSIKIWDVATDKQLKTFNNGFTTKMVVFSPDGRTVAYYSTFQILTSDFRFIEIWDLGMGKKIKTIFPSEDIIDMKFNPDGRTLALLPKELLLGIAIGGSNINIWDLVTGKKIKTLPIGYSTSTYGFSPDGKTLASASGNVGDSTIKIWDVATGKLLKTLTVVNSFFGENKVVFSPDGRTLASTSLFDNSGIRIWDIATGKQLKTLTGHSGSFYNVVFSPDGKTLASGSWDNSIKIWDVATGKLLKILIGHNNVVFSPDGKTLASWNEDSIKIWKISER